MVTLNEADRPLRSLAAEALKVDELISLNRFPATRMLPAADLHHDIHGRDLRVHARQLVEAVAVSARLGRRPEWAAMGHMTVGAVA